MLLKFILKLVWGDINLKVIWRKILSMKVARCKAWEEEKMLMEARADQKTENQSLRLIFQKLKLCSKNMDLLSCRPLEVKLKLNTIN